MTDKERITQLEAQVHGLIKIQLQTLEQVTALDTALKELSDAL